MPDTKISIAEQARKDLVNQGNLGWWVMQYAVPLLDQLEQSQREAGEYKAKLALQIAHSETSQARVAELTAEVEEMKASIQHAHLLRLKAERDASEALAARMRGALEPFAKAYERLVFFDDPSQSGWMDGGALYALPAPSIAWRELLHGEENGARPITVGDLRQARQALQEGE